MVYQTSTDFKNSCFDGVFANGFGTLTGGAFLTGFALHLGMNEFMIGLLAAMPFMATIFQLPVSFVVQRKGKRKKTCILGAAAGRLLWIPILILGLLSGAPGPATLIVLLCFIFLSHISLSISSVHWQSWMSDLIPYPIRGSFFGARNMVIGAAGMTAMIVYGKLLDLFQFHFENGMSIGLAAAFSSAVIFGSFSLYYLWKVSDPPTEPNSLDRSFWESIRIPFRDANFRKFLLFSSIWSFAVHFSAPFIALYLLRDLGFSYGFVALLGTVSSLADLIGMRVWGRLSDKVRNMVIIRSAGWIAAFFPLLWITARPDSLWTPILLQAAGGGFWAGITLCTNNLLLGLASSEDKGIFFSVFNISAGIGAALGPILAGFIANHLFESGLTVFGRTFLPLHAIFFASTLMRLCCLQLLNHVHEPEESSLSQMVRLIRNIRGLSLSIGLNFLIYPFIEITRRR